MDQEDNADLSWKFITYKQGVQVAAYDYPADAVGDVIKAIVISDQKGISIPNEAIRDRLRSVIDRNILTLETVSKLTEIDEDYLLRLLDGAFEQIDMRKMIHLIEIVEKLR
jgi:hypothetical protein